MSAVPSPVFDETPQRAFPRHPINVPLDLIALRSGVPENLPGRCTDISEAGVGAVLAGEMAAGQQVAVELRLPNLGVPVRARALVRYQSRFRCGLEFVGLSVQQREMIRYWIYRSATEPANFNSNSCCRDEKGEVAQMEEHVVAPRAATPQRRIRIGRRALYILIVCMLAAVILGWWQWQKAWNELEAHVQAAEPGLRTSPETVAPGAAAPEIILPGIIAAETMEKRIVTKIEPIYPEAARTAGIEGLVVLDAVIAPDGSVQR